MKKIFALLVAFFAYIGLAMAVVNINTANKEQLESLPGIGPVKAQAIIEYRAKNGLFKTLEELKKVNGIGDKTFDGLKSQVTLTGVTKIEEKKSDAKKEETPAALKKDTAKEKTAPPQKVGKKEVTEEKPSKKPDQKEAKEEKTEKDGKKIKDAKAGKDNKTADVPKK